MRGIKVFALVGRSGTGKSFRAMLVAQKYNIELIIDDGLLIRGQKILAGQSAKKEKAYLAAVKTALFDRSEHREEVIRSLEAEKFKKILIIGTSERMVRRIAERLELPAPDRVIQIEDVATEDEIKRAVRSRQMDGNHVIPVPAIEVKRNYPHIFYDTVKVFLKKNLGIRRTSRVFEKAVVRPSFSARGRITISEAALSQMVLHCIYEYGTDVDVRKVTVKNTSRGYAFDIIVDAAYGTQLSGNVHSLQEYIIDSLERFTGILVHQVNIIIQNISNR
jgi:uncharacterized alkaline shock family protein YloU/adenylate kinase family enzyme